MEEYIEIFNKDKIIFTRTEATEIIDLFEDVLFKYNIKVPSPEDDERDEDDQLGLYGTTYDELLNDVENKVIEIIKRSRNSVGMVRNRFN